MVRTILRVVTGVSSPALEAVLSRRERQVLDHVSEGMTNAQIASELGVSTHAVKFHLASIYRKLGVANRTEATTRYITALARSREVAGT